MLRALAGKSDALAVKAVQTALTELGLYSGLIDGDYGPATEAAIEEVQREANLEVDGAFGPETAAALNERYEEEIVSKMPVSEVGDVSADMGDGGSAVEGRLEGGGSQAAAGAAQQARLPARKRRRGVRRPDRLCGHGVRKA